MKKNYILILLLFFVSLSARSQFFYLDEIAKVKELEKKTLIIYCDSAVQEINDALKNRWTFSPYKVVSYNEADNYSQDKNNVFFSPILVEKSGSRYFKGYYNGIVSSRTKKRFSRKDIIGWSLGDENLDKANAKAELIRQISMMNAYLTYAATCKEDDELGYKKQSIRNPAADVTGLDKKTLLVRKEDIKPSLSEIKQVYKGEVKLATSKDFAKAILDADPDKALLIYMATGQNLAYFIIQDAAMGKMYYFEWKYDNPMGRKMKLSDFEKIFEVKK